MPTSSQYSPVLADLLANLDWGDPDENRKAMLTYGLNYVDQSLYGLDTIHGEIVGIQAAEKRRKSTLLINILYNVARQLRERGQWICIDTLESGMPPEAFRDILVAIRATHLLIASYFGADKKSWPSYSGLMEHKELGPELGISKEFLRFKHRSKLQQQAIESAMKDLRSWPILIFGPSPKHGWARDLSKTCQRWQQLYLGEHPKAMGKEVRIFAQDHVQQVSGFDSDYQKLEAVVNRFSDFVTTHPGTVVFVVSQVSVTSLRQERQGFGPAQAKGGAKLGAEVNTLFRTRYDKDKAHRLIIETQETRRRPPPTIVQEIEPESGAFLGPAKPSRK